MFNFDEIEERDGMNVSATPCQVYKLTVDKEYGYRGMFGLLHELKRQSQLSLSQLYMFH